MAANDAAWMEDDLESVWREWMEDGGTQEPSIDPQDTPTRPQAGVDRASGPEPTVPELAVVEQDLPDGLFGFTRRDSSHVNVNSNLYKVDKERTIRHEKTHHRHPKDELTIRYINGDIDVKNTLSFQANNAARIGNRSGGGRCAPSGAAAYGTAGDTQQYAEAYADTSY